MINTPLETYEICGREIFVKREDLQGDGEKLPRWGKIQAIKAQKERELDNQLTSLESIDKKLIDQAANTVIKEIIPCLQFFIH